MPKTTKTPVGVAIALASAAYANGGAFVDVGETMTVGDGKLEITRDRAQDLVDAGRATSIEAEPTEDEASA